MRPTAPAGCCRSGADDLVVRRASAPQDHTAGARRARQDPAAGIARRTLCVPPVFGERIIDQGADQSVPSEGSHRAPTDAPTPGDPHRRLGGAFLLRSSAVAAPRPGVDFIICYRMSMADFVEDGQSWDEIIALATEVEAAGATLINTGIGWHEARVPTIVTSVPNSAFADISNAVAQHVTIPVVASNRINMPQSAEQILADGAVQLISMARPLLSDPDWVRKA